MKAAKAKEAETKSEKKAKANEAEEMQKESVGKVQEKKQKTDKAERKEVERKTKAETAHKQEVKAKLEEKKEKAAEQAIPYMCRSRVLALAALVLKLGSCRVLSSQMRPPGMVA